MERRKYVLVYLFILLFFPYDLLIRLYFAWYVCYDMLQFKCTKDAGKLLLFFFFFFFVLSSFVVPFFRLLFLRRCIVVVFYFKNDLWFLQSRGWMNVNVYEGFPIYYYNVHVKNTLCFYFVPNC